MFMLEDANRDRLARTVRQVALWGAAGFALLCAGCRTTPPDFSGKWHAINGYPEQPQAIALTPVYSFYVTPIDGTLKALLERWARESKTPLTYGINTDFTLHSAAAEAKGGTLQEAVAAIAAAYVPQGVAIVVKDGRIVVAPAAAAIPPPLPPT